jgi:hypothetical protein
MNIDTIWEGIIIGGVGGFIAGMAVWIVSYLREKYTECNHKKRIYEWIYNETKDYREYTVGQKDDQRWHSTLEIASLNNLTDDRVKYICSIHKKITRMIKKDLGNNEPLEEKWAIKEFIR